MELDLARKRIYDRRHCRYSWGDFKANEDANWASKWARVCTPSSVTL